MANRYDKMDEYISSVFNVFQMVNKKAEMQGDKRLKMIALVILNYSKYMAKQYNVDLLYIEKTEKINLIPVFEYISSNNIELLDFENIDINDININKKEDLEKFVLSHIYYITQSTFRRSV
jgi:hypothetical protein